MRGFYEFQTSAILSLSFGPKTNGNARQTEDTRMRRLTALTAAIVFGLGLAMTTPTAAQENSDYNKQVRVQLDLLRADPFSNSICHLYERYELASGLLARLLGWSETIKESRDELKSLGTSQAELRDITLETARELAVGLNDLLEYPDYSIARSCTFNANFYGQYELHKLNFQDDYLVVEKIRELKDKHPESTSEIVVASQVIDSKGELDEHVLKYAQREGPELLRQMRNGSHDALIRLHLLFTKEGLNPTVMNATEKDVFRVLFEHSKNSTLAAEHVK